MENMVRSAPSVDACLSQILSDRLGIMRKGNFSTEAALYRIWAGIHYRSDVTAAIGGKVGDLIMEKASQDGSGRR